MFNNRPNSEKPGFIDEFRRGFEMIEGSRLTDTGIAGFPRIDLPTMLESPDTADEQFELAIALVEWYLDQNVQDPDNDNGG